MKRFEQFNEILHTDENAEEQALGMLIAYIEDHYNIDIDNIESLKKRHLEQIKWLNEEIEY